MAPVARSFPTSGPGLPGPRSVRTSHTHVGGRRLRGDGQQAAEDDGGQGTTGPGGDETLLVHGDLSRCPGRTYSVETHEV
ncbi:hypothetical protein [Streptomyces cavernae]|uniref:hypothetical protein n=1 Tax=Streptomyces cavernae TaxID=2259034 RepID=UPI001EE4766E|nr:hypothetical protein [Streptomyces cavernae]